MENRKSSGKSYPKTGIKPVEMVVKSSTEIGEKFKINFILSGALQHGKAAIAAYNAAIKGAHAHLQYNKLTGKLGKISFFE